MLLTITCTTLPERHSFPATDLGFLLHKNPASLFEKATAFGAARVFYPEATAERCTAALLVEVDPVGLVRGNRSAAALAQYVSDRPYAASSFLSVALGEVFGTALAGRCKERPDLADTRLPLSATLHVLDCDGGEDLIRRVWEPLGYAVELTRLPLDERFPAWGESDLYTVTVSGDQTARDLLTHLYVLVPVLDNAKHYGVGEDEVEKLVRRGEGWLHAHPEKDLIARRYLRYKRRLADAALARLADIEGVPDAGEAEDAAPRDAAERRLEAPARLNDRRIAAAVEAARSLDPPARRVIDLGCGEGKTMEALRKEVHGLEHVAGMDVSSFALERAARRLRLDRLGERERERVTLFHGSLVYRDARLAGYDVALLTEVIEHLDPDRLRSLVRVVFEHARPRRIVVTTPNAEYNGVWAALPAGKFRHPDHRFEWTRAEFGVWAEGVAGRQGYTVAFVGIGDEDDEGRGTPTQMAVFDRLRTGEPHC
uniref:Small RNA 2'-O-methyltransferase n=1 Tax=uncultured Armatimonadetes bacterium TaxID=157466 RepID=A0A6J4IND2_9BACT|nr:HEN1 C-terminal domain; double-stranded RNA 3'-methylase [uncultured Armatimonadetes bacterium]